MALRDPYDFAVPVAAPSTTAVARAPIDADQLGIRQTERRLAEQLAPRRATGLRGTLQAAAESEDTRPRLEVTASGETYRPHVLQPVVDAAHAASEMVAPLTTQALDERRRGERDVGAGEVAARFGGDVAPWIAGGAAGRAASGATRGVMSEAALQRLATSAAPSLQAWARKRMADMARNAAMADAMASGAAYEAGQAATGQSTPEGAAVTGVASAAAGRLTPLLERLAAKGWQVGKTARSATVGGTGGAVAGGMYAAQDEDATLGDIAGGAAMGGLLGANAGAAADLRRIAGGRDGLVAGTFSRMSEATRHRLDVAKDMAQSAADPVHNEEIYRRTGWWMEPDGKWRYEVSDKDGFKPKRFPNIVSTMRAARWSNDPGETFAAAVFDELLNSGASVDQAAVDLESVLSLAENGPDAVRSYLTRADRPAGSKIDARSVDDISGLFSDKTNIRDAKNALNVLKEARDWTSVDYFSDVFSHPSLEKRYPMSRAVKVGKETAPNLYGSFSVNPSPKITLMSPERGTAAHEMQHAVQYFESFGGGGSPSNILTDPNFAGILEREAKRMEQEMVENHSMDKKTYAKAYPGQDYDEYLKWQRERYADDPSIRERAALTIYKRLLGETESRAVEARMSKSQRELRRSLPWERDVKRENLIVENTASPSSSQAGTPAAPKGIAEYRGHHKAPLVAEDGAMAFDTSMMFPGLETHPEHFRTHTVGDWESIAALNYARGRPDAILTIYRAVPKSVKNAKINPGDWVTMSRSYAAYHGEGPLKGDFKIISKRVPARELVTEGNSINEWGWIGPRAGTPAAPKD